MTQAESVDAIIRFEQGELGREETIDLFQYLIDTGLAWSLQGSYGRMAQSLLDRGLCLQAPKRKIKT